MSYDYDYGFDDYQEPERDDYDGFDLNDYQEPERDDYDGFDLNDYQEPEGDDYDGFDLNDYQEPEGDDYDGFDLNDYQEPERDDYDGFDLNDYQEPEGDDYDGFDLNDYQEPERDDYDGFDLNDYQEPERDDLVHVVGNIVHVEKKLENMKVRNGAEDLEHGTLNKKQYSMQEKVNKIAALKPGNYKNITVKHKPKIQKLFEMWENVKTESSNDSEMLITEVQSNCVCFQDEFLIGRGCEGTEVYICLGSDGIERAIKRLPKHLCQTFLKNERDILSSRNAVDSPQIVNYWFYDETSSPDFGYLILNLYEQNLDEYIKDEGNTVTETSARKMIRQMLQGLKALHSREPRSLHRDLKPSNILVDVNGDLALSDFGIGKFFPEQGIFNCIM